MLHRKPTSRCHLTAEHWLIIFFSAAGAIGILHHHHMTVPTPPGEITKVAQLCSYLKVLSPDWEVTIVNGELQVGPTIVTLPQLTLSPDPKDQTRRELLTHHLNRWGFKVERIPNIPFFIAKHRALFDQCTSDECSPVYNALLRYLTGTNVHTKETLRHVFSHYS